MKRRSKSPGSEEKSSAPTADAATILQVKVWLTGISPMLPRDNQGETTTGFRLMPLMTWTPWLRFSSKSR